jgi:hypothetical protein
LIALTTVVKEAVEDVDPERQRDALAENEAIGAPFDLYFPKREVVKSSQAEPRWKFYFRHHPNKYEPFYIAKYDKIPTKHKIEILAFELSDKEFTCIEDLPAFAIECKSILNTKEVMTVVSLFREFMCTIRNIEIPAMKTMKAKSDVPPKLLQDLLLIIEDTIVLLCYECGQKCVRGNYCSRTCETARMIFRCSTPGCDSTKMKQSGEGVPLCHMMECVKCKNTVADRRHGGKGSRVMYSQEMVVNESHEPAWRKRARSAA